MDQVLIFIAGIFKETWHILNESSVYILFGFSAAAILKTFIPDSLVKKQLGGNGSGSVLKAALFGIPIPMCCCGTVPFALGLRKQGASRGATTAFLISTPETGVDSIAITYALLGPLFAVYRPIAAFFSAIFAGFLENIFNKDEDTIGLGQQDPEPSCGCDSCPSGGESVANNSILPLKERFGNSIKYAFGDLLGDIGKWLLIGLFISGIISYAVPDDFFSRYLGGGFISYIVMLVMGIPIYICATSSTPLAAALILKGMSPGAALIFLLAGPATNAATMAVVGSTMGKRSLVIYLSSIAVAAVICGYILDLIFGGAGINIKEQVFDGEREFFGVWTTTIASGILLFMIARSMWLEKLISATAD